MGWNIKGEERNWGGQVGWLKCVSNSNARKSTLIQRKVSSYNIMSIKGGFLPKILYKVISHKKKSHLKSGFWQTFLFFIDLILPHEFLFEP